MKNSRIPLLLLTVFFAQLLVAQDLSVRLRSQRREDFDTAFNELSSKSQALLFDESFFTKIPQNLFAIHSAPEQKRRAEKLYGLLLDEKNVMSPGTTYLLKEALLRQPEAVQVAVKETIAQYLRGPQSPQKTHIAQALVTGKNADIRNRVLELYAKALQDSASVKAALAEPARAHLLKMGEAGVSLEEQQLLGTLLARFPTLFEQVDYRAHALTYFTKSGETYLSGAWDWLVRNPEIIDIPWVRDEFKKYFIGSQSSKTTLTKGIASLNRIYRANPSAALKITTLMAQSGASDYLEEIRKGVIYTAAEKTPNAKAQLEVALNSSMDKSAIPFNPEALISGMLTEIKFINKALDSVKSDKSPRAKNFREDLLKTLNKKGSLSALSIAVTSGRLKTNHMTAFLHLLTHEEIRGALTPEALEELNTDSFGRELWDYDRHGGDSDAADKFAYHYEELVKNLNHRTTDKYGAKLMKLYHFHEDPSAMTYNCLKRLRAGVIKP